MPRPARSSPRRTSRRPATDHAEIAGEAAHAINNALGMLFGAEYLVAREARGTLAEALAALTEAATKLQRCTDALNLLAQRAADLRIPRRSPATAVPELVDLLCQGSHIALHWATPPAAAGELAVARELLRWLVSCALFSLSRGTPRDGRVLAGVRISGRRLSLTLEATGTAAAAAGARPNLQALALQGRRALLAAAGVRITTRRLTRGQSVKLSLPMSDAARPRKTW